MIDMAQVLNTVITRSASWAWIDWEYHPDGPVCPGCGQVITGSKALSAWRELRCVYCAGCGKKFEPTVGTPIHTTSWQPEELIRMIILAGAGSSRSQIATALGKSINCIRDMQDRLNLLPPLRQTLTEQHDIQGYKGARRGGGGVGLLVDQLSDGGSE